ncbi:pentatricopeptide repeat-containing protein at1g02150 [Phtheirospermum japonicum]|uniref:Pentatricopeptide repeat-containing protein at1g02150 n=1 Tax=Phtheirospermum japonicum TaxID=374723 RepID=A0A830BSQ4_9LAMI|nr:pentatricopeptide repeat-containing protein at1g02150 [Phtheirospermum japonicum]
MLLQPTTPKPPPNHLHQNHNHIYSSNALSFSSGFSKKSTFLLKQPILSTSYKTRIKNPVFINCSSISQVHSYGTVDYERRPLLNWSVIYKKISMLENTTSGSASVLNQLEKEGNKLTKWDLSKVVKKLRDFRRYKLALEVYEWMNNRPERFRTTTSDTAIQLDLISKVHDISTAEQYFQKLPDNLKDNRIYGSLLNVYVQAKMREKAENLMDKMRNRNYTNHSLPFNVMMTLYKDLKDQEKIESLISEMMEKKIALDLYTYNIWLSSCGSLGSLEKMEQVFQQMEFDKNINPNWTTFSTMASMYVKSGHVEKAEECMKKIEGRLTGRDRLPYHYLISLYGSTGNREEVYRIWNIYKASFVNIPNLGYHAVISALVRADDINGAEKIYDEWLSVKSAYDSRVGNLILSFYVRNGLSEKAEGFFEQMIGIGGKPNSMTWEIMSEDHIRNTRVSKALSCFQSAVSAEGPKKWKPKPINVCSILKIVEERGDLASKEALLGILRQTGCFDDMAYMSYIPLSGGGKFAGGVESDEGNDGNFVLVDRFEESL